MPGTTTSAWTLPFTGDAPTKTQRLLHGLLSVGVQWGFARLRRHGLLHGWGGAESVRILPYLFSSLLQSCCVCGGDRTYNDGYVP